MLVNKRRIIIIRDALDALFDCLIKAEHKGQVSGSRDFIETMCILHRMRPSSPPRHLCECILRKQLKLLTILVQDAKKRLENFYFPYNVFLNGLLMESKKRLGYAVLFDCHSMPSKLNLEFSNSQNNCNPDIILGDLNGNSCSSFITNKVKSIFEKYNFLVTKNHPFSGGYITKKYGDPSNHIHVIQIEINKKLYMDENTIERSNNFENLSIKLTSVIEELSNLYPIGGNIAAE